jgi:hypothetical protein
VFQYDPQADFWQAILPLPVGCGATFSFTDQAAFLSNGYVYDRRRVWQLETQHAAWQELTTPQALGDTFVYMGMPFHKDGSELIAAAIRSWPDSQRTAWSQLAYSHNDGVSWTYGPPLEYHINPDFIRTFYSDTLSLLLSTNRDAPYSGDSLFLSEDLGQSWRPLSPLPSNVFMISDALVSASMICVWDANSQYRYYSTDRGITWQQIGVQSDHIGGMFLLNDEIFATRGTAVLHWTGSDWEQYGQIPGLSYCAIVALPPATLVGVAYVDEVWVSSDTGRTWDLHDCVLPFATQTDSSVHLTADPFHNRIWLIKGIGTCYLDLADLSAKDKPILFKPADYTVLSCYPNPFNSTTRIRFDLLKRELVKVDVYDLQGRHVRTLVDGARTAGRQEVAFDGEGMASGTYFVRLKSAETTRTEKILLLK